MSEDGQEGGQEGAIIGRLDDDYEYAFQESPALLVLQFSSEPSSGERQEILALNRVNVESYYPVASSFRSFHSRPRYLAVPGGRQLERESKALHSVCT